MKIFALETDSEKVKAGFRALGEQEIFTATPHVWRFLFSIAWDVLITIGLLILASIGLWMGFLPVIDILGLFSLLWFIFVFFSLIEAYLNWRYDFLFLTTDKLVIVDQQSIFRKSITPINLENLGDVMAETQWLNLFGFGIVRITLKEGHSGDIVLRFMPEADKLVAKISQQITLYQRRKDYVVSYRAQNQQPPEVQVIE